VETATPGRYLIEINGPIEWQLVRDVEAVIKKGGRINSLTVNAEVILTRFAAGSPK
jgi:hypothetical protein